MVTFTFDLKRMLNVIITYFIFLHQLLLLIVVISSVEIFPALIAVLISSVEIFPALNAAAAAAERNKNNKLTHAIEILISLPILLVNVIGMRGNV
jgi:hypothetical protein